MSRTDLGEVLRVFGRGLLSRVRTGLPARVVSYDPTTNCAEVEIVVENPLYDLDDERTYEEFPQIPNVPILWPRAGGYVVTLPLGPGDFVWLAFSELPLAEWRTTGQRSQPVDARRHSIGYPYATPGAFPDTSPLSPSPVDVANRTAKMVLGKDGSSAQIVIDGDAPVPSICLGRDAIDYVALSSKVDAVFSAIATAVTVPNDGGAAIKAAVVGVLATQPTTAATKTKAE